ncbi:MAG: glycosyltransferase family 2 protein [Butyrivibrio sp.]|nr:glycosyltransferase family 2 protein [Butyrivibrio sp.]MBQ8032024.1 glycosyltransferase family 2 protein [Butyrivibrio sp.]MBR1643222.1 glycosyltransferase family 2 protein [Butyrivibrio sp.]
MGLLSVIVPCLNEQENVSDFYHELLKNEEYFRGEGVDIELIFVDDGSTDGTVAGVKELIARDKRVHLVSFSRNFGKEAAMYAGLSSAKGDYVAIMDCDLQDPPALLPQMYQAITKEGYDSVATRRVNRKGEPPIRSFFARQFYKLINKMTKTEIVDGARDYRLMSRKFVNAILSMEEYNRFSKGIFGWVGFKNKWLEFENIERKKGETKWSFWKLFVYAIDGIMAFSTAPLAIASFLGIFFCIVAFIFIILIIIRQQTVGDPHNLVGWASMVCIILFVSGVQLFCVGVVGQYLAKAYLEVKKRPLYIVKEEL